MVSAAAQENLIHGALLIRYKGVHFIKWCFTHLYADCSVYLCITIILGSKIVNIYDEIIMEII